ncbi:MAG: hypothetical protein GC181_13290 [Bacteroidetes bacterium]|nr:hypothetical protein [Bacteroidota bacterium]
MNNMDKLNEELKSLKRDFASGFDDRVISSIQHHGMTRTANRTVTLWTKRVSTLAAACVVALFLITYFTYGRISKDSLLGIDGYSSVDISESYETYSYLYNE